MSYYSMIEMLNESRDDYEVRRYRSNYGVFKNGELISTADTQREAEEDMEDYIEQDSKTSKFRVFVDYLEKKRDSYTLTHIDILAKNEKEAEQKARAEFKKYIIRSIDVQKL